MAGEKCGPVVWKYFKCKALRVKPSWKSWMKLTWCNQMTINRITRAPFWEALPTQDLHSDPGRYLFSNWMYFVHVSPKCCCDSYFAFASARSVATASAAIEQPLSCYRSGCCSWCFPRKYPSNCCCWSSGSVAKGPVEGDLSKKGHPDLDLGFEVTWFWPSVLGHFAAQKWAHVAAHEWTIEWVEVFGYLNRILWPSWVGAA
jgi:hypothetical protein